MHQRLPSLIALALVTLTVTYVARGAPTIQRTKDNRFQLTLPDGWGERSFLGGRLQDLEVCDAGAKYFVALSVTAKEDLVDPSIEAFEELVMQHFGHVATDIEPGEATQLTVNGHPATQRIVRCAAGNVRWVYLCTMIETDKSFVSFMCCSTASRHNAGRAAFDQIIASFREVNEMPPATTQPADSGK